MSRRGLLVVEAVDRKVQIEAGLLAINVGIAEDETGPDRPMGKIADRHAAPAELVLAGIERARGPEDAGFALERIFCGAH